MADAYLDPVWTARTSVRTGALATRILVESGRAVGVAYQYGPVEQVAYADAEVILSGGAINSPQLLMLSGIGPASHLREVGVDVLVDLPGVGRTSTTTPQPRSSGTRGTPAASPTSAAC